MECLIQFWPPQYKTNRDIMREVQERATEGLEHLTYTGRLRDGDVQSGERQPQGHLINSYKYLMVGRKEGRIRLLLM